HAIDDNDRKFGRTGATQTIVAVASKVDLIAATRQCIDEMFGCFTVVLNDQNAAACSSHAFLISNLRRPDEWTLIRRRTLLIESKIQILTFLSEFNLLLICVICSDCVICSERLSKQH